MAALRITNRAMFWRIIRRLFGANPGRLFVMLLALGAGAAVTAALLNLQVDAKRRLTTEFSVFGPNILVMPRDVGSTSSPGGTMDQSIIKRVPFSWEGSRVHGSAYLFLIADASSVRSKDDERRGVRALVLQSVRFLDCIFDQTSAAGNGRARDSPGRRR